MGTLFLILLAFFALRAVSNFARGRVFAGLFAAAACLLFLGGLYADHASQTKARPQAVKRVT